MLISASATSWFPRLEFAVYLLGPCLLFGACDLELVCCLALAVWNLS
jgi:hypothetical protein